jgi:exodeoxyribonuclease VII large subunit
VITSPSGAAVRDILHVLRRRFPAIPVLIYPVSVQGEGAAREITRALQLAARRRDCDVLILARGGGSLEDLMAFNDESVARAIAACPIPLISGVGHETDFTISDFVADERAPTPSGAAERAVPDRTELQRALGAVSRNVLGAMRRRLLALRHALRQHERGLARAHPGVRLRQHAQRLDELEQRLRHCMDHRLERSRVRLGNAERLLSRSHPGLRLRQHAQRLLELQHRIQRCMDHRVERARVRLANAERLLARVTPARRLRPLRLRLDNAERRMPIAIRRRLRDAQGQWERLDRTLRAVSPLATLERGYAIVLDATGHVVTDATAVHPGATIEARLARGAIRGTVDTVVVAPSKSNS